MADNLDLFVSSFNQYLVAPANVFGLGGFVFDIEGETQTNLSTEITDHYLEDNTAIQDHIAVRPKKITLKSYVGELVFRQDPSSGGFIQKAAQKLTSLSSYAPQLSQAASQIKSGIDARNISNLSNLTLNDTVNYWNLIKNLSQSGSRQQQAYMYFKSLMENKIIVSVQTPFEFVSGMAVESIIAIQTENTKFMSDFSIVLKQIRTVSELSVTGNAPASNAASISKSTANSYITVSSISRQARNATQSALPQSLGNMPGLNVPVSDLINNINSQNPGMLLPANIR